MSPTDTLLTPSPGENVVTTDPSRTFPDLAQILAGNTNAQTGQCPAAPVAPTAVPPATIDCYSEFLPTAVWTGFLGDRTMNFRLTARDGHVGGGGVGSAATQVTVAPLAGPFLVTSQGTAQTLQAGEPLTVTWDVAGTDVAPVDTSQVRITLSTDGGATFPYVLAAATANDGSAAVVVPNVITSAARIKVAAVGNVYFDLSDLDLPIVAAAVATPSPAARDFGVQTVGSTSAARTVTITNTGTAALHVTAVTLGATNPGDFAIATDACSTVAAVATGDSCTIDVTFKPTATGPRAATLTIAGDAVTNPTVVDLGGEGVAAPVPATTTTTAPAPPAVTTTTTAPAPPALTTTTTAPAPPATTVTATTSRPPTTAAAAPVSHPTSLRGVLASPAMLAGSAVVGRLPNRRTVAHDVHGVDRRCERDRRGRPSRRARGNGPRAARRSDGASDPGGADRRRGARALHGDGLRDDPCPARKRHDAVDDCPAEARPGERSLCARQFVAELGGAALPGARRPRAEARTSRDVHRLHVGQREPRRRLPPADLAPARRRRMRAASRRRPARAVRRGRWQRHPPVGNERDGRRPRDQPAL